MKLPILNELKKHPKGLFVLFFLEVWERFSYYGMRAILVLFLVSNKNEANPGMGWDQNNALELYGWYTALVYIACIPGGFISDKFLGKKKSLMVGGWLLCFGHLSLALQSNFFFFLGLVLIILGVGLLKPNISSLVGHLYSKKNDLREQGFTIFYIGINIGAFLSSIIVGFIGEYYGWHYGFSIAGLGMVIGQIVFLNGSKHIIDYSEIRDERVTTKFQGAFKMTKIESDRLKVLIISFLIIIIFWASFEQAGGLMNLYAFEKTDRTISFLNNWIFPASWFQSVNPLMIIIFGLPISSFWLKLKKQGYETSSIFKMIIGLAIMGTGFIFMYFASNESSQYGKSAMYWIFLAYFFHTIGELCASPVILSFITKLAPLKYVSSIMGIYFASIGIGNKFAGMIGQSSQEYGESEIFFMIFAFCLMISLLLMFFIKTLNRLSHNADT